MFRFIPLLPVILLLALPPGVEGEEAPEPVLPAAGEFPFIPISRLIEAVRLGFPSWRPDWPLWMPADAFLVSGDWSAITLEGPSGELVLRRTGEGSFSSFPFFYGGNFLPVDVRFDDRGSPAGFIVGSDSPLWIEFLESPDPLQVLVRIMRGEAAYFALIRYTGALVLETWYDGAGTVLGVYSGRYESLAGERRLTEAVMRSDGGEAPEEYAYDSQGNITAVSSPAVIFSAQYILGIRPRYRRIRALLPGPPEPGTEVPGSEPPMINSSAGALVTMQWDEGGFLVRLSGETAVSEESFPGEEGRIDRRYDYSLDGRGNWTERREISWFRRFGYLVPARELVLQRRIEYREGD